MAKKEYIVKMTEYWSRNVSVYAESKEEAIEKIVNGEGTVVALEYLTDCDEEPEVEEVKR